MLDSSTNSTISLAAPQQAKPGFSSFGKLRVAQMRYRGIPYQAGTLTAGVRNPDTVLRYRGWIHSRREAIGLRPVPPKPGMRCYRGVAY